MNKVEYKEKRAELLQKKQRFVYECFKMNWDLETDTDYRKNIYKEFLFRSSIDVLELNYLSAIEPLERLANYLISAEEKLALKRKDIIHLIKLLEDIHKDDNYIGYNEGYEDE